MHRRRLGLKHCVGGTRAKSPKAMDRISTAVARVAPSMRVKVCGVTTVAQAVACADAGVDSIGLNFVASSVRRCDEAVARDIVREIGSRVLLVAVVSGLDVAAMRTLRESLGVACLQLHGHETAHDVSALLPHAYKAVPVAGPADVAVADAMPGDYVLVDAKVEGALGGTGKTFDWTLVAELCARRKVVLAGGLTPDNVASAVAVCSPFCVDVASGVESAPGIKDLGRVRAFVAAARSGAVAR